MLEKNKVLISGIISGLLLIVQQLWLTAGETDLKVIGLAVLIMILGVLGNSWKMQGITITGLIGTVAYTAYEVYNSGNFTWHMFAGTALIAVLTTLSTRFQEKEPPSTESLTNKPQ